MSAIYQLLIIDTNGNDYRVFGGSDLQQVWKDYSEATFEADGRLVISGFTDEARRRAVGFALDRGVIRGMILIEQ